MHPTSGTDPGPARLYGFPFVALLVVVFLGFANNALVQPILPILILERGGDATLVGIVIFVFAVPSLVLRPFIGHLVDRWSRTRTFILGTTGLGVAGFLYLIPGLGPIFVTRAFHGAAWAAFNTGGNSTLAELAPPSRRGEAAGMYNLMPSIAHMVGPTTGLVLLGAYGFAGPFALAGVIGIVATVLLLVGPFPRRQVVAPAAAVGFWRGLIERRALLPMFIEFLWITGQTLFVVFPPVFAAERGIPVTELTLYYLVMGAVLIIARLVLRQLIDRYPRHLVLGAGIAAGIVALGLAIGAETVPGLLLAACIYSVGSSATSPIATAIAIDRADPKRRGAAMATYSLGWQLGFGLGGATWGVMIDAFGYPAPYIGALVSLVALLVLVAFKRRDLVQGPSGTSARDAVH